MKLSRSMLLVLAFSLLTFSASAQPAKTAKDSFDGWKKDNRVKMEKGNWWALSAIVEKTEEGAKVGFYITAAGETGRFGATDIIVQPVVEYYDQEGVPRTTDVGKAASLRIPAMVINKGQADERAARPEVTVAMPPTANAVKITAKKVLNKETVTEIVLGMNGDGYAGTSVSRY